MIHQHTRPTTPSCHPESPARAGREGPCLSASIQMSGLPALGHSTLQFGRRYSVAEESVGICEHCGCHFEYWLCHCGFAECMYAYCDSCGKTSILSAWDKRMPRLPDCPGQQEICAAMEPYILGCECGGRFKKGSWPRCPRCQHPLSAQEAASYIEKNAPGHAKGWNWQRNWTGIYCIVVGDRRIQDNFAESTPAVSS